MREGSKKHPCSQLLPSLATNSRTTRLLSSLAINIERIPCSLHPGTSRIFYASQRHTDKSHLQLNTHSTNHVHLNRYNKRGSPLVLGCLKRTLLEQQLVVLATLVCLKACHFLSTLPGTTSVLHLWVPHSPVHACNGSHSLSLIMTLKLVVFARTSTVRNQGLNSATQRFLHPGTKSAVPPWSLVLT